MKSNGPISNAAFFFHFCFLMLGCYVIMLFKYTLLMKAFLLQQIIKHVKLDYFRLQNIIIQESCTHGSHPQ
jgi:hypothetical protein